MIWELVDGQKEGVWYIQVFLNCSIRLLTLQPEYSLVILFLFVIVNLFCSVVPFKLKHYFLVGGGRLVTFKTNTYRDQEAN